MAHGCMADCDSSTAASQFAAQGPPRPARQAGGDDTITVAFPVWGTALISSEQWLILAGLAFA